MAENTTKSVMELSQDIRSAGIYLYKLSQKQELNFELMKVIADEIYRNQQKLTEILLELEQ